MRKVCNECGIEKAASEFYSNADRRDGKTYLSAACRPCTKERLRRNRSANRDRLNENQRRYWAEHGKKQDWPSRRYGTPFNNAAYVRARRHMTLYGLTTEQYDEMHQRQDGLCAICRQPETMTYKGTVRSLAVDHDHETNAVRGLLCVRCNAMLGLARDDGEILLAALDYLEAWWAELFEQRLAESEGTL